METEIICGKCGDSSKEVIFAGRNRNCNRCVNMLANKKKKEIQDNERKQIQELTRKIKELEERIRTNNRETVLTDKEKFIRKFECYYQTVSQKVKYDHKIHQFIPKLDILKEVINHASDQNLNVIQFYAKELCKMDFKLGRLSNKTNLEEDSEKLIKDINNLFSTFNKVTVRIQTSKRNWDIQTLLIEELLEVSEKLEAKDKGMRDILEIKDKETRDISEIKDRKMKDILEIKDKEAREALKIKDEEMKEALKIKDEEMKEALKIKDRELLDIVTSLKSSQGKNKELLDIICGLESFRERNKELSIENERLKNTLLEIRTFISESYPSDIPLS